MLKLSNRISSGKFKLDKKLYQLILMYSFAFDERAHVILLEGIRAENTLSVSSFPLKLEISILNAHNSCYQFTQEFNQINEIENG